MAIDAERRQQLADKHGIYNRPQPDNPIVNAIYGGERLVASAFGTDPLLISALCTFDPMLHDLLRNLMRDLHSNASENQIDLSERQVWVCQSPGITPGGARACDVCPGPGFARPATHLLPITQGAFVLVLACCDDCRAHIEQTVHDNMILSQLEAQAKLPPGAVIDPLSPVPPRP